MLFMTLTVLPKIQQFYYFHIKREILGQLMTSLFWVTKYDGCKNIYQFKKFID